MNIETLKSYFSTRKDIAFAFLFGSHARGTATKLSDVDIAVYFYPRERHPVEYEEEVFYDGEHEICFEIGYFYCLTPCCNPRYSHCDRIIFYRSLFFGDHR